LVRRLALGRLADNLRHFRIDRGIRAQPDHGPGESGQQAARRRGVKFGRPRVEVDAGRLSKLRDKGASFAAISKETGLSVGTVFRTLCSASNMQASNSTKPQ